MVARSLNNEQIDGGEELLKRLDDAGVLVDAALWFYFPDSERWKLLLSLPTLIKKGPKVAYREVQKALRSSDKAPAISVSLDNVAIARENSPLLSAFKRAIKTGPGISRIGFSNNVIDGQLITDALIYRLN